MRVPKVKVNLDAGRVPLKHFIERSFQFITFIMAVSMIIFCIAGIQYYIEDDGALYAFALFSVPLVCSALILADRHRSIFFAVGLFAISLSFSRFIRYLEWVHSGNNIYYWVGIVLCILALNMMYSGFRYVSGNSRSITTILMSAFFFVIVMTIEVFLAYRIMGTDDKVDFLRTNGNTIAAIIMYIIYIGLVWSEPIRKSTEVEKMSRTLGAYRAAEGAGPNAYIHRDVAESVVDFVRKGNPVVDRTEDDIAAAEAEVPDAPTAEEQEEEIGVVASILLSNDENDEVNLPSVYAEYVSNYTVNIMNDGPLYAQMDFEFNDGIMKLFGKLQKWDGPEGPAYLSISDHREGSCLDVRPFRIIRASIEGTDLQIEYTGGRVGHFTIRHVEDGPVRRVHSIQPKEAS